jgi:hypothetical protein
MMGAEIEGLLRRIVREELARLIGVEPEAVNENSDDEAELRARVAERAAKMRAARGGR